MQLSPNYSTRQVFSNELEDSLAEYILTCSRSGYGLTSLEIRQFAYQLAQAYALQTIPKSWHVNLRAGEDWFVGYMSRHKNLSARKPEQCSVARAMAFNKTNIANYFEKLEDVINRNPNFANGSRIYNLDETGTSTVGVIKKMKIIGEKGAKQIHQIKSAERGVLVTTCCIIGANGCVLPPVMVFPRAKFKRSMTINAYPGTLGLATKNGWMTAEIFVQAIRHFIKCTNSSKENPTLLILDNVASHLSIDVINLCRENGVILFTLPPHTTHKTQPLDVGVFGPFQTAYSRAYHNWTVAHPGEVCTIYDIAALVNDAICKAAIPSNIFSAFRATGIYPFNKDIFSDLDFAPSQVTENPPPNQQQAIDLQVETQRFRRSEELVDGPEHSVSHSAIVVTPKKIRPLPKAKPKEVTRKPREKGKCRVATDSAEKHEIQEKHNLKTKKEEEKEAKKRKKSVEICKIF